MTLKIEEFISIIVPISAGTKPCQVASLLDAIRLHVAEKFLDIEVIIVDSGGFFDISKFEVDADFRSHCYLVRLSRTASWDEAALAGIERANGDWIAIIDPVLHAHIDVLHRMRDVSRQGFDIVGLRSKSDRPGSTSLSRRLFFAAQRLSDKQGVGPRDRREFLISRRAANWIVRDASAFWYLNEAFVATGLAASWLEVELPHPPARARPAASDLAWGALARSSIFLRKISMLFSSAAITIFILSLANAIILHVTGVDLFGNPQQKVPGWTYVVVILSFGFSALVVMMHFLLMINIVIIEQTRRKSRFVIEYFGRI